MENYGSILLGGLSIFSHKTCKMKRENVCIVIGVAQKGTLKEKVTFDSNKEKQCHE